MKKIVLSLCLTLVLSAVSVLAQDAPAVPASLKGSPCLEGYTLVQGMNIANQMYDNLHKSGTKYELADNVQKLKEQGVLFDRVGYCLEYAPMADAPLEYVFVTFDSANMTTNVTKIGVPDFPSGIFYQQVVKNLEVTSNVKGVQTGNFKRGYLEFWPCNYGQGAKGTIAGRGPSTHQIPAEDTKGAISEGNPFSYDINDAPHWVEAAGYGSMQVHNLDALQTVFAFNSFVPSNKNNPKAFGIGNAPSGEPDYTFNYDKGKYAVANLYTFIRPCKAVLTTNEAKSGIEFYQRGKDGSAMVPISGTFQTADGVTIETIEAVADTGAKANLAICGADKYLGAISLPAGWHSVTVTAKDASGAVVAAATLDKIGVGEIFITCGQSNSANHGDVANGMHKFTKTGNAVMYDLKLNSWIPSCDPQRGATGENGSTWVPFADALSEKLGVPVGTVATGYGGSSVSQWQPGTDFLENRLLPAIRALNGNFAGILWHQGESDHSRDMKKDEYYNKLRTVIYMSRKEAGWDVPWGVALVSYCRKGGVWTTGGGGIEAQKQIIAEDPLVFEGPNTDVLTREQRGNGGNQIHFSVDGLDYVGQQWANTAEKMLKRE